MTETTKPEIEDSRLDELIEMGDEISPPTVVLEITAALRELKALRQENEWISVENRLPESGAYVLAGFNDGDLECVDTAEFDGLDFPGDFHCTFNVTHWRPLPAPPAPRTEEQP